MDFEDKDIICTSLCCINSWSITILDLLAIALQISRIFQVVIDYDDLAKIPYFRTEIESLTKEAANLRYFIMVAINFFPTKRSATFVHNFQQIQWFSFSTVGLN